MRPRRTFACLLKFYAHRISMRADFLCLADRARSLPRARLAQRHASPARRETARYSGATLFF